MSQPLDETRISKMRLIFQESLSVKEAFMKDSLPQLAKVVDMIVSCYRQGGKVLLFGNGGSSSDACHIAGELVSRFYKDRKGLPAIALGTNMATLTSISNDYSYEDIFSREVEAHGQKGDIAIGISTSGNSKNVLKAMEKARQMGLKTIALTGGTGGKLKDNADLSIVVPSKMTPRIQETHITLGHAVCELVEEELFA
ncbi:D-sedoheptulose 7-phosphate isomerase [Leptospirillum ferrooxidans]|uniref:Phosphoheptose isomerase n=1 Tax=Leptospirillum ferrooxidans (strain C2-3) TaxID=1162668 RepID=I0IRW6_LEPFC|nr:D-sedoheptulose 7-phosphate isomerase [Leptospirillum ferrooxidans]BAM08015.1 putative phosphoheptose isomerase [Leptospirillum ferrooxidans C2-3]